MKVNMTGMKTCRGYCKYNPSQIPTTTFFTVRSLDQILNSKYRTCLAAQCMPFEFSEIRHVEKYINNIISCV